MTEVGVLADYDTALLIGCRDHFRDLAAFTHNREGSMSAFEAERLDVGTGRF